MPSESHSLFLLAIVNVLYNVITTLGHIVVNSIILSEELLTQNMSADITVSFALLPCL